MNKITAMDSGEYARVGGSFRDPSGHVYRVGDRIIRTVTEVGRQQFEFARQSGILEALVKDGRLLPFDLIEGKKGSVPLGEQVAYVLEVPKLPFVSFPYEWPFPALKAAALLHLDIQISALERSVTLCDSSAYNVQFLGTRPTFIDHLSFRRYEQGEVWAGHRQFCEQFLIPLLLRALFGITHNAWYRGTLEGIPVAEFSRLLKWRHYLSKDLLTHIILQSWFQRSTEKTSLVLDRAAASVGKLPVESYRKMLKGLRDWIVVLEPLESSKSTWQDYSKDNSYQAEETLQKASFIRDFAASHRPKQVWDFGCNVGAFARASLQGGAGYVVGFDFDQGALDGCYTRASADKLPIQPIVMDMANVSPNQGWMGIEREGLDARRSADAIVALAVVHHLVITRNIPLGEFLDWLVDLAPCGVIEFVPKQDPMVHQLLALREDIFDNYNWEFFKDRIAHRAQIDRVCTLRQNGRMLLSYVRRSNR
jgi:ribosomal protein L11 methylase PrmA